MKKIYIFSISCAFLFCSCASIFLPKSQKVIFNTGNKESEVYLDKDMIGDGKTFTAVIDKKEGQMRQLTVKREGYKDQYSVMFKTHRPTAFWILQILNPLALCYYGFFYDFMYSNYKCTAFDKVINLGNEDNKLVTRDGKDKYLHISNIKLNLKNTKKDLPFYNVIYDPISLKKAIETAEIKKETQEAKEEEKKMKKNKNKNKNTKTLEDDDIKYDDTKFSYNVYQTLKKTGFIDTVIKIFQDNNNTLVLEASINKISTFNIRAKYLTNYYKSKVYLTWYIKNTYNEILDSIVTSEMSGDFTSIYTYDDGKTNYDGYGKMVGDAIDISYLKLHHGSSLGKHLKMENDFKSKDALLTLKAPTGKITDKSDASVACVTIKMKDGKKDIGHGSGFAISQDGYIITNYHIVAGRFPGKFNDLTIINSDGIEIPAKVIRVNSYRDLALIKAEGKFQKQFGVNSTKSFKKMQDVYTIGTPKSIELGQSVSSGIISNERKTETTNLLQLSMSINSGNSGGPLFDSNGNLLGVIVAKLIGENTEGVGFAIPSYLIEEYLNINFK